MADDAVVTQQTDTPPASTSFLATQVAGVPLPPNPDAPAAEPDDSTFDASAFEVDFGLPEGTLSGVTSQEDAVAKVREYADSLLAAGILAPSDMPAAEPPKPTTPPVDPASAPTGNAEYDKLRAEFNEFKASIQQQQQASAAAQIHSAVQQLNSRIDAEVDKWNSERYGTSKKRSYKQVKALKEFRDLVATHLAGYQATQRATPQIEAVLRQARAFDDPDFNPRPAPAKPTQPPLGTPGAARGGDDSLPRNIHVATFGRR